MWHTGRWHSVPAGARGIGPAVIGPADSAPTEPPAARKNRRIACVVVRTAGAVTVTVTVTVIPGPVTEACQCTAWGFQVGCHGGPGASLSQSRSPAATRSSSKARRAAGAST